MKIDYFLLPFRNFIVFFLVSFLVLSSFQASSQSNPDSLIIGRMAGDILGRGKSYDWLRILCKKVGPRLSGSPGAEKAVRETFNIMKEAGADTVYLQDVKVPHWVRGEKEQAHLKLVTGKELPLAACALGNSVATPATGIEGAVLEVANFTELEKLGREKVNGKIIFFNYKMNPLYVNTFLAYRDAGIYRGNGPSMAARYGAKGVVIRSLASNVDDFPHTGTTRYNDSFPSIPAIAISTRDADKLSLALKQKQVAKLFFKTSCQMLEDVPSHNVIGELRGSENPEEIITVGGHLDSWDLGEGAHDDGAGCVQSIEIIRVFKSLGIKPKRTIRVVMFMNEENGLRGGTAYGALAANENKKHLFALESDAGGFTPRGFMLGMTANQIEKIRTWKSLFYPYGVYEFTSGGGGADIGPLQSLGTALAGLSPDSQRYFDIHHARTDVFESVSQRELLLGAVNMAALVYLVSEHGL